MQRLHQDPDAVGVMPGAQPIVAAEHDPDQPQRVAAKYRSEFTWPQHPNTP